MSYFRLLFLLSPFFIGMSVFGDLHIPQKATEQVSVLPIRILMSNACPEESIWVRARIVEKIGDDTYVIQDESGRMIMFLPTDDLITLDLQQDMEILVFGKVDISPVSPNKNELYAERVLLPPN